MVCFNRLVGLTCKGMEPGENGSGRASAFALVAYVPSPLGKYLDDLRCELAPNCIPRAHVTILPPRPLQAAEAAWKDICSLAREVAPFMVSGGSIRVFPDTKVIYLEIDESAGRQFRHLHDLLNTGPLEFEEVFEYHPHITLAQELKGEDVPRVVERASQLWNAYPGERRFLIDSMTFVHTTDGKHWEDLAQLTLGAVPVVR